MGCDGFQSAVEEEKCGTLGEGGTVWELAAASLHNDVLLHLRRMSRASVSLHLILTMIRSWEALRAPEVAKWQQKYRVGWDATDGRIGGAERIVWETLLEMENQLPGSRKTTKEL